jgi:hypothetical protein
MYPIILHVCRDPGSKFSLDFGETGEFHLNKILQFNLLNQKLEF